MFLKIISWRVPVQAICDINKPKMKNNPLQKEMIIATNANAFFSVLLKRAIKPSNRDNIMDNEIRKNPREG